MSARLDDHRVSLVVTDLDGTLWGPDETVHPRTLDAIAALHRANVPVLAATGRRLSGAITTLRRNELRLPMVVLEGSLGRHSDGVDTFHQAAFDPADARRVLAAFRACGLSPCVYVDRPDAEVVADVDCSTSASHLRRIEPERAIEVPEDVVAGEAVLLFTIVDGDVPAMRQAVARIGDSGSPVVSRDVVHGETSTSMTLTVRPPRVSKWEGVLAWCREQAIDPGRVLAVGDGQNDVELLDAADVACAISDGCEEVRSLADHMLAPPETGGWAEVLSLV